MNSTRLSVRLAVAVSAAGAVFAAAACGGDASGAGDAAGAGAIGKKPAEYEYQQSADSVEPKPGDATDDAPDAYDKGCQVDQESAEPKSCTYGDPDGKKTVALVGDSKALQWISALDIVGKDRGWKVVTFTKSTCTFAAATISKDGKIYESCSQWNKAVTAKLKAEKPDVVLTSQGKNKALDDPDDVDGGESEDAMVAGLTTRWADLAKAGLTVAALRDNPHPAEDVSPVYECVEKNLDDLGKCAFDRAEGEGKGGGPVQVRAVEEASDVTLIDLNDYLCPGDKCPPVIGDVLVYREGSHLTKTYIDSLAPQIEKQLAPVVDR